MDILEMFIDERDNESGIEAVSVVEHPAIELDFIALNKKEPVKLAEVSKEKRILMGVALVPDKPIYRNQNGKEFYIYFSKDTVRKASELFFKKGYQSNTTEEHEIKLDGNTVVESWIKEDEVHDKSVKFGLEAPIGSWIISLKVDNDETYQKAKEGKLKGFSIEGYFTDKLTMKSENLTKDEKPSLDNSMRDEKTLFQRFLSFLKFETKLEKLKLEDGRTRIEAELFEPDYEVFILNGEDRHPMPKGEYKLENGQFLSVVEEGIIASIGNSETKEDTMDEQVKKEEVKTETAEKETLSKMEFSDEQKTELSALIAEGIKSYFESQKETEEVVETKAEEVVEEVKEEVVELSQEVKPLKHSPEKKTRVAFNLNTQGRTPTQRITEFLNNK